MAWVAWEWGACGNIPRPRFVVTRGRSGGVGGRGGIRAGKCRCCCTNSYKVGWFPVGAALLSLVCDFCVVKSTWYGIVEKGIMPVLCVVFNVCAVPAPPRRRRAPRRPPLGFEVKLPLSRGPRSLCRCCLREARRVTLAVAVPRRGPWTLLPTVLML